MSKNTSYDCPKRSNEENYLRKIDKESYRNPRKQES